MRPATARTKILIAAVGIIFIFSISFFQKGVKSFFYFISSPIQKSFLGAGSSVSGFFEAITNLKALKKDNGQLQSAVRDLLAENVSLKELENENKILREALQIGLQKDFQLTLAEVIGKDIGQDSILINKGSRDGLSEGMPAVTEQKILIGKIHEAYDNFSRVSLITDKESSFDVKLSDKAVSGVIKGKGGSKMLLDFVPREKEVNEGDLAITTALGGVYPAGLLAGIVKEVRKSDVEPFQIIEVSPLFSIAEIGKIFLIINSQK